MRNLLAIVIIAVIVFFNYQQKSKRISNYVETDQGGISGGIVQTNDHQLQFKLPGHWKLLKNLNKEASLQVGNLYKEQYMVVLSYSKLDFVGGLEDHFKHTTDQLMITIQNPTRLKDNKFNVNGMPAMQSTISAKLNRLNITYLQTSIEGQQAFHQVLCWTLTSKRTSAFPVFNNVIRSTQEINAPAKKKVKPTGTKVAQTSDKVMQFQVPASWETINGLNDEASFQMGHAYKEQYMIVISEPKIDFDGTLAEYSVVTTNNILSGLADNVKSEATEIDINGMKAIQCAISGTIQRLRVHYLHTVIVTENDFHQVLCWTLSSKKESVFPTFYEIINSATKLK